MTKALWKLPSDVAHLTTEKFRAKLDPARPEKGLFDVSAAEHPSDCTNLLAVRFPPFSDDRVLAPVECHARQTDFRAAYAASTAWPVCVDTLWRGSAPMAVELVVSVQTDQLFSQPELTIRSRLAADEILRLVDTDSAVFDVLDLGREEPIDLRPDGGAGCLLFRHRENNLTYVEMIHPADFHGDQLKRDAEQGRLFRVDHSLFREPLEKGVIRRARVQGLFLPGDADTRLAAAAYAKFAASEPLIAT